MDTWASAIDEAISLTQTTRARRPGDFTIREYMTRLKDTTGVSLSRPAARNRLEKLVEEGILRTEIVTMNSRGTRVYWKAEEEE